MLSFFVAALILMAQTLPHSVAPHEVRGSVFEAMRDLGEATGLCLAHLPVGAKDRLDAGALKSPPRNDKERLFASFHSGFSSGQANSARAAISADQCAAMMQASQDRVESAIASAAAAGI